MTAIALSSFGRIPAFRFCPALRADRYFIVATLSPFSDCAITTSRGLHRLISFADDTEEVEEVGEDELRLEGLAGLRPNKSN